MPKTTHSHQRLPRPAVWKKDADRAIPASSTPVPTAIGQTVPGCTTIRAMNLIAMPSVVAIMSSISVFESLGVGHRPFDLRQSVDESGVTEGFRGTLPRPLFRSTHRWMTCRTTASLWGPTECSLEQLQALRKQVAKYAAEDAPSTTSDGLISQRGCSPLEAEGESPYLHPFSTPPRLLLLALPRWSLPICMPTCAQLHARRGSPSASPN
jgi:hypothetical protein